MSALCGPEWHRIPGLWNADELKACFLCVKEERNQQFVCTCVCVCTFTWGWKIIINKNKCGSAHTCGIPPTWARAQTPNYRLLPALRLVTKAFVISRPTNSGLDVPLEWIAMVRIAQLIAEEHFKSRAEFFIPWYVLIARCCISWHGQSGRRQTYPGEAGMEGREWLRCFWDGPDKCQRYRTSNFFPFLATARKESTPDSLSLKLPEVTTHLYATNASLHILSAVCHWHLQCEAAVCFCPCDVIYCAAWVSRRAHDN